MAKVKRQRVKLKKNKISFKPRNINVKGITKFLTIFILVSAVAFGLVRIKYMFVDSDYFFVKTIDMNIYDEDKTLLDISLKNITDDESILGSNIFMVDLKNLKKKIESLHVELKDVVVSRILPDKLVIESILRKPLAQIHSDRYYFVDKEGVLLPEVKNFPSGNFPIIEGVDINLAKVEKREFNELDKKRIGKAITLIKKVSLSESLSLYKIKMVNISDLGSMFFFVAKEGNPINIEIKIGDSDFTKRLNTLATVLKQIGDDVNRFKYIDLRFEDPVICPK